MVDDMPKKGLSDALLDDAPGKKKVAHRMTVATTDGRLAKQALEMRNRRASAVQSDLRNKRASVATSDARMMEDRRCQEMADEFAAMVKMNTAIDKGVAKSFTPALKKIGRRMSAMAGVETKILTEQEEEEEEAQGCSNTEALLNMLNNALGTGLLALSSVFMNTGLVIGISTMVFSCCFNCFTMMTHMNACRIASCDPAGATLGEVALGKTGFYTMTIVYVVICFFCMVSYVDVSADAMKDILKLVYPAIDTVSPTMFKIVNWAVLLVPGTFIRSLGGIAVMSLISFIGALSVLATILIRCGGGMLSQGIDTSRIAWWPESPSKLLAAAPVLILAYAMQAGGGIIIGGLKDNSQKNQTKVCCVSFFAIFLIEIIVGLTAYLFFLDTVQPDVMVMFPSNDPVAITGRVGVLFMVMCGYVMLNVPTRVMLIQLFFDKNESQLEASPAQFYGTNIGTCVSSLLVGLAVSDLSMVLGLCGSVATPMIAFILPATFMMFVRAKSIDDETEVPLFSFKQIDMYTTLLLGCIFWLVFVFALVLKFAGYQITNDWGIAKM